MKITGYISLALAFAGAPALCAPQAFAFTVYFANGSTMEVEDYRVDGDKVVLKVGGGEAVFDKDQFDMDKTARDREAYRLVLEKARGLMDEGRAEEAAGLYKGLMGKDSQDAGLRKLLAAALAKAGRYEEAVYEYRRIQEIAPGTKGIRTRLGEIYYRQGAYYEAIDQFLLALDEDPEDKEARLGLGMCYAKQEMYEGAKTELEKAVALKPDYAEAYATLGYVHYKKSELDKATELLNKSVKLNDKLPEAHYYMGLVYGVLGVEAADGKKRLDYFDKSIEAFRKAVTLRNVYPEAHADLGVAYYNRGAVARAVEEFNISLTQKPDMAVTHNNLAGIYNHRGFYEAAVAEAAKAVAIDPYLVGAYLIMGNAYANMRNFKEAARSYDRYLYYSPNDPLSDEVRMRLDWVLKEGGLDWPLADEDGGA